MSFILEQGIYGQQVVVTGPWSTVIADYMRREGIRELYLNQARGWTGSTLGFLETVPDLIAFSILDFSIEDVSPVHQLSALRSIEVSTYCDTTIDFGVFPDLERCVLYWRANSESVFSCPALRWLFLHRYSGSSSEVFARSASLEELFVANAELREIEHLATLARLKVLGLYNLKRLASLRGLGQLVQLEALEINGCKGIDSLDELSALVHLRRLHLNDDGAISSLRPIRSLSQLEEFLFYESTNIVDGDLTPLIGLPYLRNTSFQNRRHYSHTRENLLVSGPRPGSQ